MPSRTIAYLTPLYFDPSSCLGGGERYPLNLARGVVAASKGQVRVELISFGEHAHRQPLSQGVDLRVLPVAGRPANPLDVVSWELPDALRRADLVHIHQAYTRCAEAGMLVAKQQRKPVCVTDHGGMSSTLGAELGLLDLADHIVAYSDFGASMYRTSAPIAVIKGGVDAELFAPPAEPRRRDRFLFVGRLLPHKGIDRLIEAMPPDLPLTVCGRPYHPAYFDRLRALAAGKRVEFVTDADDPMIRDFYGRAWATVLPSVYRDCEGNVHQVPELMGFTLLESMACGTPAIASRVGAMPEFVEEGVTGFIYDDPAELTRNLRMLAGEDVIREAMGSRARAAVLERFDLRVAGDRLWRLYDGLIGRTRTEGVAA